MIRTGRFLGRVDVLAVLALVAASSQLLAAADAPQFSVVEAAVSRHFQLIPGFEKNDIISQSQVGRLFGALAKLGWDVAGRERIVKKVLSDGDFLVTTLRSQSGTRYMRKVSSEKLMYDRLDRVAQESGGKKLIGSLVTLPNGELYSKRKRAKGVPDLPDLLPKQRNGQVRRITDYDKPTGRIYTVDQLVQQLKESYQLQFAK